MQSHSFPPRATFHVAELGGDEGRPARRGGSPNTPDIPAQSFRQTFDVAGGDQRAQTVKNEREVRRVVGDHLTPSSQRLKNGYAVPLVVGGDDEDIGLGIQGGEFLVGGSEDEAHEILIIVGAPLLHLEEDVG